MSDKIETPPPSKQNNENQTGRTSAVENGPPEALSAKPAEQPSGVYSDQHNIDTECEGLLRNTKKQVKQMMEEAVTKKFIHEESSSIISLCVSIEACLSHGLKRRALGLFKTSSSTALVQKVAKSCREAQEVLEAVSLEELRAFSEQESARKWANQLESRQGQSMPIGNVRSPSRALIASNVNVHKRNLWIKCALIEKKLVAIVEHLASEPARYYEPDALMSNFLCAQILASLLVGPSALEFSRSKTNNCYHFEEPTAEELVRRHKLTNPIACLCSNQPVAMLTGNSSTGDTTGGQKHSLGHSRLSRSVTEGARKSVDRSVVHNSLSATSTSGGSDDPDTEQEVASGATSPQPGSFRPERRRRPLALKTSVKRGTLLTDCHHYDCQELSEHNCTRGYSFLCNNSNGLYPNGTTPVSANTQPNCPPNSCASLSVNNRHHPDCWSLWSPRMLHETLHQNSRSSLLYAKNNVLLESQPDQLMAGYLSLHQTHQDLVLKWIPNQMINGNQAREHRCSTSETFTCENCNQEPEMVEKNQIQPEQNQNGEPNEKLPVPVESSYLDFVVHLPISRIVLLHCQFELRPNANEAKAEVGEPLEKVSANKNSEETLILVEADGVQRAPFKFPKGGLRLFLSCLQNGLQPERHLDPAIKFDNDGYSDPLAFDFNLPESPRGNTNNNNTSGSRLEGFLKRLPSLKRHRSSSATVAQGKVAEPTAGDHNPEVCSKLNSEQLKSSEQFKGLPSPKTIFGSLEGDDQAISTTSNYAYRIVSLQQPDWALQTPPLSALSLGSSSSSQSPVNPTYNQRQEKFRWSLARLTKFSAIYTNNSGSSSSSISMPTPLPASGPCSGFSLAQPAIGTRQPFGPALPMTDANLGGEDSTPISADNSCDLARIEDKLCQLKQSTSSDLLALRTQSLKTVCESMRKQILARAFYGWLLHCRKVKIIRTHLSRLVNLCPEVEADAELNSRHQVPEVLTQQLWLELLSNEACLSEVQLAAKVNQLVYHGGIECDELRKIVWPYLLGHYKFTDSCEARQAKDQLARESYETCGREWIKIERVVKKRDSEILTANMARASCRERLNKGLEEVADDSSNAAPDSLTSQVSLELEGADEDEAPDDKAPPPEAPEQDSNNNVTITKKAPTVLNGIAGVKRPSRKRRHRLESTGSVGSDASITDQFGNNIHRIDKDVQRCDRNFWYFKEVKNLDKLRNIMCSFVWQHLDVGYVQGMCDLAAPFLVIFDDEVLAFSCFSRLMKRMVENFPHGNAMDRHFESLRYLLQVLDPKLFQVFQSNGDYSHFYFCYRWLLLDFKRELLYEDVYKVWETIWSARNSHSDYFVLFMALAMVRYYRDIIIENNMDFTDTIKFFNEMAEKHKVGDILRLARNSLDELRELVRGLI